MGRWSKAAGVLFVVVLALLGLYQTGAWVQAVSTGSYERTTVTAVDANGTELATVEARVAETRAQQIVGLSRTASLGPDEGMVFVYEELATHAFVMRNMAFPLDIVFVAGDGTVTEIHHADAPDGLGLAAGLETYSGRGRYVLEVNRGWTNRTGLDEGDRLRIPLEGGRGTSDRREPGDGGRTDGSPTATETRPTVTAVDANGTTLATVRVRIADDRSERRTGLSATDSLARNEGMLFVHDRQAVQTYIMPNMSFPLDMVFVAANGTVTTVHHAPVPEETPGEDLRRYSGTAKYVLEVNRGWTNRTGLDEGDRIVVPDAV